jgi:hypothetical protein
VLLPAALLSAAALPALLLLLLLPAPVKPAAGLALSLLTV